MLNSTKCLCGRELKGVRFDTMKPRKFDDRFYGGRVSMEGTIKCECGRELLGYFEQAYKMNTKEQYELINLEVIKDTTPDEKIDLNETSSVENLVLTENEPEYIGKTYEEMTYDELKKIAKEKGIKANQKREIIIEELKKYTDQ